MRNIDIKFSDNIILLSVVAGIFIWLALVSFLHLLVFMISKYVMIITSVSPEVNFWSNELLYLLLFTIITVRVFNVIKTMPVEKSTAINFIRISVIVFIFIHVLQFLISYYYLDTLYTKYLVEVENYQEFTRSVSLINIAQSLGILRYLILGILIYKK